MWKQIPDRKVNNGYEKDRLDYKETNEPFNLVLSNDINTANVDASGTYGSATVEASNGLTEARVTFGLINKTVTGDPTLTRGDEHNRGGRLGFNYGKGNTKTNLAQHWYGEKPSTFAYLVSCSPDHT